MKKTKSLSRSALFDLVWSMPMKKIAEIYEISDRGLSKACKKMLIPTPIKGYWNRVISGNPDRQPSLPLLPENYNGPLEFTLRERTEDFKPQKKAKKQPDQKFMKPTEKSFSETLIDPHPLVVALKANLENKEPDKLGDRKNMLTSDPGYLKIMVSPETLPRALRAYDLFIKTFESKGYKIEFLMGATFIWVDGEPISVKIYEKGIKKNYPGSNHLDYMTLHPSGLLVFDGYLNDIKNKWIERKGYILTDFLESILVGFKEMSARMKLINELMKHGNYEKP